MNILYTYCRVTHPGWALTRCSIFLRFVPWRLYGYSSHWKCFVLSFSKQNIVCSTLVANHSARLVKVSISSFRNDALKMKHPVLVVTSTRLTKYQQRFKYHIPKISLNILLCSWSVWCISMWFKWSKETPSTCKINKMWKSFIFRLHFKRILINWWNSAIMDRMNVYQVRGWSFKNKILFISTDIDEICFNWQRYTQYF